MRIAYIVSAYKYPHMLIRLVRRLHTAQTSFFIHVDKKSPDRVNQRILESIGALPRVYFLRRHSCYWGGFGHVRATLKAMARIFDTGTVFDYAILLTGQDYPIKSNDAISAFLEAHQGTAFIDYFPLPSEYWDGGGIDRIRSWHFRPLGRHVRLPGNRAVPGGLRPYGGSSYWCLPEACVAFVYEFVRRQRAFVNFFRYVDVPDELFFQTIILNSPWRERVANDNLHFIEWREAASGSPSVLLTADFEQLVQSPKLFARKFDPRVDNGIVDMIDSHIMRPRYRSGRYE